MSGQNPEKEIYKKFRSSSRKDFFPKLREIATIFIWLNIIRLQRVLNTKSIEWDVAIPNIQAERIHWFF